MRNLLAAAFLVGVVFGGSVVRAQPGTGARLTPAVEVEAARVGAPVRLALRVVLPPALHVQSNAPRDPSLIPTVLILEPVKGLRIDQVIYPAATALRQEGQAQPLPVFGPDFVIGIRATVTSEAAPGKLELKGQLRYQACDDKVCYAPANGNVAWTLNIVPASAPAAAVNPQTRTLFSRIAPPPGAIAAPSPELVASVRVAIALNDIARGEQLVTDYRSARGVNPEVLLALSWLGRGALAAGELDRAEKFARETYELGLAELKKRPMDQEPVFPTAFGAAIEVLAQVSAQRGARSEAVGFLENELKTYGDTSIHKRIQKNLNLVTLEGSRVPALDLSEVQVLRTPRIEPLNGKVVIYYFWAHWCPDCKEMSPILEKLLAKYRSQGLAIVAPTTRYGYGAGGAPLGPDEEKAYIAEIRSKFYAWTSDSPMPLSENNHRRFGVSTTPTLVLADRQGIVRLYKPGKMSEADLEAQIQKLL